MGAAIAVRADYSSTELRRLAGRVKNAEIDIRECRSASIADDEARVVVLLDRPWLGKRRRDSMRLPISQSDALLPREYLQSSCQGSRRALP
jgi:hypothetical protein